MKKVLILGNGTSRLQLKDFIQSWKNEIWVCNTGFLEYEILPRIDYVCSVHREVVEESKIFATEHKLFYKTISNCTYSDEQFKRTEGWSTGNLALAEALEKNYDEIHLIGFDFGGKDVYHTYEVDGSNFKKQYNQILNDYKNAKEKIVFHYPEENKKKIKFITMIDDNFVEGFKGFFKSLLKYNPDFNYEFILLNNGLIKYTLKDLKETYQNITLKNIRKELYDFPLESTTESLISTYYKLEIFDKKNFDKDLERLIFMDMDILIQGSIGFLTRVNLNGKGIGACRQYHVRSDSLKDEINSGVLIIDFKNLKQGAFKRLLKRAKNGAYLPDQEVINREFIDKGYCFYLPKIYNVEKRMCLSKSLKNLYRGLVCLHYVNTKPWQLKAKAEKQFLEPYKRWWKMFEVKENLNLSEIPLKFRHKNSVILNHEKDLYSQYNCIFISKKSIFSESYLKKIMENNLLDEGYICGYGNAYQKNSNPGKILKILKKKPDLYKNDFWLYFKEKRKEEKIEINLSRLTDFEFEDYLRGKSVVLVGPSPIMEGRKKGKDIDNFDVVIRTNGMIDALSLNKDLYEDFGKRSDILYINVTYERDNYDFWQQEKWEKFGLKYICRFMQNEPKRPLLYKWRPVPNVPKLPPPTLFLGTRAIADLLSFPIRLLYITGMDAYECVSDTLNGKNEEYIEDYLPEFTLKQRERNIGGPVSKHDKYRDTKYILELEKTEERLVIDSVCKQKMKRVAYGKD